MSYTEIYSFDKQGVAHLYGEVHNAFRSGMAIWRFLESKYLPPFLPDYVKCMGCTSAKQFADKFGYVPSRTSPTMDESNVIQEIWDLYKDSKVSWADKICLYTTFDGCLVKKKDIPQVIEAFRAFEGDTSLKEQAEVLERLIVDENCIAVGWNQTSVNGTTWDNCGGYDEENEQPIPYNCLTGDKHFWLFDHMEEVSKNE